MRILVTGAAGRVGSTVAKGLLDRHDVRGHDRVEILYYHQCLKKTLFCKTPTFIYPSEKSVTYILTKRK